MGVITKNTFGNSTLGVLGIRGYFRAEGESEWVDLGIIDNWEPTDEIEELEITGARTGLTVVHEVLPISASLGYTFDSKNPNDDDIAALWSGAAAAADVATTGSVTAITFGGISGELLWVRENAQAAKPSQIVYHPSASIRRSGQAGTPGEEATALSFEATVTSDETYTVPAGIVAEEPAAPYGYFYKVPTAGLDTALTAVSAAPAS